MKSNPALVSCERGASAVELALCLAVFLGLIFGVINIARVLWIVGSLHFAAESAARCASANTTTCGSASAIQNYALNQYHGESLGGTNPFTYSATGCGNTVSASYTYSLSIAFFGTYSLPLAATACFP